MTLVRRRIGAIVTVAAAFMNPSSNAQPRNAMPADVVEMDPLRCWWRASTTAVVVGEPFALTITCAVIDTSAMTVEPELTALEPAVLQLSPFHVVTGKSFQDIHAAPLRYLQREYTLRLLDDRFFGQDIEVPPTVVSYHVHSLVDRTETEGRTQTYVLPALPIRVLSLVPQGATDIQDAPNESFRSIETRRTRATREFVSAAILLGFAVVLIGVAITRSAGRSRERGPVVVRSVSRRRVLRRCLHEMRGLSREVAHEGWTAARVGRAQASLRLATAIALGRPVAQRAATGVLPALEGQLLLRTGFVRPRLSVLSAPTTPGSIDRDLADPHVRRPGGRVDGAIHEMRHALEVFDTARYGRSEQLDRSALDLALESSARAVTGLRFAKLFHRLHQPTRPGKV